MKTYQIIIAAAFAVCAAACSQNEPDVAPAPEIVPESGATITLTATLPAVKGYDNDGKVTWEVGDVIAIATNKQAVSGGSGAAVITLTASDIVSPTTASFTVSGDAFDGATNIYAVAVSGFPAWTDVVNAVQTNGTLITNKIATVNQGYHPHVAYAACTPGSPSLSFKNVGCIFKWTTGTPSAIHHVSFTDNDGSKVRMNFQVTSDGTVTPTPNPTYDNLNVMSNTGGAAGPYYMFVAPNNTFAHGITLTAYKAYDETDANRVGKVVLTKSFTTTAGKIFDFGTIEDYYYYDTYFEQWEAGQDIKIGGITYNKSTYTGYVFHVDSDRTLTAGANGMYFVDDGVTLTTAGGAFSSELIIIGNTKGTRSIVINANPPRINNSWLMKNVDITTTASGTKFIELNAGAIDKLVIDNCKVTLDRTFCNRTDAAKNVNDFILVDSDVLVTENDQSFLYAHAATGMTFSNIKVKNNVFWSKDGNIKTMYFTDAPYANGPDIGTLVFENNTFYDVSTSTGSRAYFLFNTVTGSISVKSNLYYTTTDANNDGSKGHTWVLYAKSMTSDEAWAKAASNNVNSFTNYAWNCAVKGTTSELWYNGITQDKSASPFTSFNTADGSFVIKEEYKQYGASR